MDKLNKEWVDQKISGPLFKEKNIYEIKK